MDYYEDGDDNDDGKQLISRDDVDDAMEDFARFDDDENVLLPGIDDLPLFASPEARQLDLQIKEKQRKIETTVDKLVDVQERAKVMKEHFKNVKQELDHTNALLTAKNAETQTETHLRQLAIRALGKAGNDSKSLQSEIETVQDQLNSIQNLIYKANEKMDEFKMQMNWNQEGN